MPRVSIFVDPTTLTPDRFRVLRVMGIVGRLPVVSVASPPAPVVVVPVTSAPPLGNPGL